MRKCEYCIKKCELYQSVEFWEDGETREFVKKYEMPHNPMAWTSEEQPQPIHKMSLKRAPEGPPIANHKSKKGRRVVPIVLAHAIDMAAGKKVAGKTGEPAGVLVTTLQSKCKESGKKRITTIPVVSWKDRRLGAFTYRMGALQLALRWPLRTEPSRNGDFRADGLLIGSRTLAGNARTHLAIDRGGGLYGPRYAFAVCVSALIRTIAFQGPVEAFFCRLYHHVLGSKVREEVYADAEKSRPERPFDTKMIRNVPHAEVAKWELPIHNNDKLDASGDYDLESGSLVTEEAVQAALWHTAHTTIPGLEAIAKGDFADKKGTVRTTSGLLAADLRNAVDRPKLGRRRAEEHQRLVELTRPKSWAHLWRIYRDNFPVPDFDELNFGRAGVDYPEKVYAALVKNMRHPDETDSDEEDEAADSDEEAADEEEAAADDEDDEDEEAADEEVEEDADTD